VVFIETGLNEELWLKILNNREIVKNNQILNIFQYMLRQPDLEAAASDIGKAIGYGEKKEDARGISGPVNTLVAGFVKNIDKIYPINIPIRQSDQKKYKFYTICFGDGSRWSKQKYIWRLRPELAAALKKYFITLDEELADLNNSEEPHRQHKALCAVDRLISEGRVSESIIKRYERSAIARKSCLEHYGYQCTVCGFNFEKIYGEIGQQKIHVHHKEMVANGKRETDPVENLIPVCPNCHYMLHQRNPPYTPEELEAIMEQAQREIF
jgi:5-methylcytosine-specific restriction protein A